MRLELSAIVIAIVLLLAGRGMNHITVHIRDHGIGAGSQSISQVSMALTMQAATGEVFLTASIVEQLGYTVFGLGMAARFSGMSFH